MSTLTRQPTGSTPRTTPAPASAPGTNDSTKLMMAALSILPS